MTPDLIFDVGMNNGDDTAYYLHKGFRVVGIEADPTLVEAAQGRFADAIRQGRLQIVNAAIGPREEIAQFWICEGRSEWNSFDREMASREGRRHYSISLPCRRFRDILAEFGTPFYLKVDIEGADHYCIEDLEPSDLPRYVSCEVSSLEDLLTLSRLGYRGFKLITQNDHTQLQVDLLSVRASVKRQLRRYPAAFEFARRLASLRHRGNGSSNGHPVGRDWEFAFGSSGPFGEDADGPWQTIERVAHTWVAFQLGQTYLGEPGIGIWHDVHATTLPA